MQHSLIALQLVERFVIQQRRWPRSWAELEGVDMRDSPLGPEWPATFAEMQHRISVDFEVRPVDVAQQDRLKFTAIRPKGPYFEYRDYGYVDSLQAAIRKFVLGKRPNSTAEAADDEGQ